MKFNAAAVFIAVMALVSSADASPLPAPAPTPKNLTPASFTQGAKAACQYRTLRMRFGHSYSIKTNPGLDAVPDIPKTCDELWSGLRRFPGCVAASDARCHEDEDEEGVLVWHFTASTFCNTGMVGSAWWEATHNEFGKIDCVNVNELTFL